MGDRRVRQAIQVAVNPDEIIRTVVLEGEAIRTASVLTSGHFGLTGRSRRCGTT